MSDDTLFQLPDVGTHTTTAVLSECGLYRYDLTRRWETGTCLTFVMLNPSTADAMIDDPTIRRCMGFARDMGHDAVRVVNVYGYRATKPGDLWLAADPVGPQNDAALRYAFQQAESHNAPTIAAWGVHARPARVEQVVDLAAAEGVQLSALHVTKAGAPGHPLYLPASARPIPWGHR